MHNIPIALVILDGFGYSAEKKYNAIAQAKTPFLDFAYATFPHTLLKAAGTAVGLPAGTIGNSEVGHLTLGAGQIIPQPLTIINEAITNKTFFTNPALTTALHRLAQSKNTLHLLGILSDAGVHGDIHHLYAFLDATQQHGIKRVIVHPFLDGRDVAPKSAKLYLTQLDNKLQTMPAAHIGTIHGRFYAMDRDTNWDRTEKSYRVLTEPHSCKFNNWHDLLAHYYKEGITDEFIPPTQMSQHSIISNGDGVIFFDFRPERERQLVSALINPGFDHFKTKHLVYSFFITPVSYGSELKTTSLFKPIAPKKILKEQLSSLGLHIFTIAETEKYAHVTYFFDGGLETTFPHETRVLIPSIKEKNYSDHPCMSAPEITSAVLSSLERNPADFYLINYANADMVGHSGNMQATSKAVECLDKQLQQLYDVVVQKMNGTLLVTADHGKAEDMFEQKSAQPRTAHTINPVPCMVIQKELAGKKIELPMHSLADVAPFILRRFID